jgi:hypothetical protein
MAATPKPVRKSNKVYEKSRRETHKEKSPIGKSSAKKEVKEQKIQQKIWNKEDREMGVTKKQMHLPADK